MKFSRALAPLAFFATLLVSAGLPADTVHFAPSDAPLTKTFTVTGSAVLDDVMGSIGGEELDPAMMGVPTDYSVDFGGEMEVTDTFATVTAGRPLDFTRTFGTVHLWSEATDGEASDDEIDDLAGKTAHYLWDEAEGSYTRTFVDDEEADVDVLDLVALDMDLRAILPEGEVSPDDEWTVGGLVACLALVPGVDLTAAFADGAEALEDVPPEAAEAVRDALDEIELVCTYAGTREDEGVSVAVIAISGQIDLSLSLGPDVLGMEGMDGEVPDGGVDLRLNLELTGECLWDVAGGHFASFTCESSGTAGGEMHMTVPEMQLDMEMSAELSVDLNHSYTAVRG